MTGNSSTPLSMTFGEGDDTESTRPPDGNEETGGEEMAPGSTKSRRRRISMTGGGGGGSRNGTGSGDGGERQEVGDGGGKPRRRNRRLSITSGGDGGGGSSRRRRLSITGGSGDPSTGNSRRTRRLSITGGAGGLSGLDADALAAVQMEEEQKAIQTATSALAELSATRQKRMDVVLSQILSVVVASLFALLENASTCHHEASGIYHRRCLRVIELTGKFLVHVESLLSTWKNEKGMLLDLHHAVWDGLNRTILRCGDASTMTGPASKPNRCISIDKEGGDGGGEQQFVVNLSLSAKCFRLLPDSALADGTVVDIPVVAVLFTQGINEQQTMANKTGEGGRDQGELPPALSVPDNRVATAAPLNVCCLYVNVFDVWHADEINVQSIESLRKFHDEYRSASISARGMGISGGAPVGMPRLATDGCDLDWGQLDALLEKSAAHVQASEGRDKKMAAVLQVTQKYMGLIGAARCAHATSLPGLGLN